MTAQQRDSLRGSVVWTYARKVEHHSTRFVVQIKSRILHRYEQYHLYSPKFHWIYTMYDLSTLKRSLAEATDHFKGELATIRTGRAAPALLDAIRVEVYGSSMPLQQVGSISVEDARTLRVSPWDQSQVHTIENAIRDADLGVSLSSDERGVRVAFPELTSERREQLVRVMRQKLEEARTTVRRARDATWQDIQKQEREKLMSEDDKFRAKDLMEKVVQEANAALEQLAKNKEVELSA